MENLLVQFLGWKATVLHGDPTVYDRWVWLKDNLKSNAGSTLDAGCGTGAFTLYAAKMGNKAVGISFNERNMGIAEERAKLLGLTNARFIVGDLKKLDSLAKELGTFEQVLCFETIEHLLDDKKLMRDLAQCLKPGGRLLLTTPFKGHNPVMGESSDRNYQSTVEDGGHVRFGYEQEELIKLVEMPGLKVKQVDYISGYFSQMFYNLWCKMDEVIPHKFTWGLTFPLRAFQFLDRPISRMLNYPLLSIAIVAEKP